MSFIYKPQPQLVTKLNEANKLARSVNASSVATRKDSIDAIDSFIGVKTNGLKSTDANFTSSPSVSSSSPGTTNHHHHHHQNTNGNDLNLNKVENYNLADSQDDLQLIDSTMSPISSSTNSAISPHLISTSSSTNLSNSTSNLNGSTSQTSGSNNTVKPNTTNTITTTCIPTRFVDRRVSTSVGQQTYKFNYSEAGQRMARKAQEQLKTVEKSKETDSLLVDSASPVSPLSKQNGDPNTNGLINEDWQNVSKE